MRIVSLFPSATETLFELGLWDQVVAITTFCTMPAAAMRDKAKAGGTKNPDIEHILELKPDVVIVNSEENRKEDAEALRNAGIPLYITHPRTIEDAVNMIAGFGHEFGAEAKSKQLCSEIFERLNRLRPPTRYRSLVLVWNEPYMTARRDTYVHSVCGTFGFDNVVEEADAPYPILAGADVQRLQPDVLLLPDEPYAFREKHAQEMRAKFPEVAAVRNNRILLFNGMYLTWHGYGTLRALREFPEVLKASGLW